MRLGLVIAATLVLAACASSVEKPPPPPPPPPPAPAKPPPQPLAVPAPPKVSVPPVQQAGADTCGATDLLSLIGRPRTEIPVPVNPSRRRVLCTTCPMTRDFRQDRLTILFDADTGRVTKLMCQ